MREGKLLELIGEIDCKYIEEANCNKKTPLFKWVALAACVALCLCGTLVGQFVYQAHYTEVSYICLDVNPSFELCLNHEKMVINVIAVIGVHYIIKDIRKNKTNWLWEE